LTLHLEIIPDSGLQIPKCHQGEINYDVGASKKLFEVDENTLNCLPVI